MQPLPDSVRLLTGVAEAGSRISRRLEHTFSLHGISFTEFRVLHHLASAPGECMRRVELAEAVALTPSGVTRLLNPMEKIHLVEKEKNPRDARVSLVRLSRAGRTIYRDALTSFTSRAGEMTAVLNSPERTQLLTALEKLS